MNIPFSPPFIDQDTINEVVDTLQSGWITTGPKVKALEAEVVKLTSCPQALCVNSWTSGAMLVLKWFGIGPGDEVIVPAYTYSATALSIIHCGAKPIMVDVREDFTIDPAKIEEAITSRTKVIMPVDIAGLMCDYTAINELVSSQKNKKLFIAETEKQKQLGRILVLSDAAHSVGASFDGKVAGSVTDITIFSFHAVKNITTAEGGVICINLPTPFNNEEEYKLMRLWTLNGQTKDAFTKSQSGGWKYDILFAGLKVNMPDLCAAVGLSQIKKYNNELLKKREAIAIQYHSFFQEFEWAQLPLMNDEKRKSCFHLYPLRIKGISEIQRDNMIDIISKLGVSVNVHFIPMPLLTLFKDMGYHIADYPIALDNYSREISLPIYPQLMNEEVKYVCESIKEAYLQVLNAND